VEHAFLLATGYWLLATNSVQVTMNAIEVTNVTKTYRKYARRRQFATLKSAILSGTLVNDLNPTKRSTR